MVGGGWKSDQLIDLAVGRSHSGSPLCIASRFMSVPGFNDISYCSHPDGDALLHRLLASLYECSLAASKSRESERFER